MSKIELGDLVYHNTNEKYGFIVYRLNDDVGSFWCRRIKSDGSEQSLCFSPFEVTKVNSAVKIDDGRERCECGELIYRGLNAVECPKCGPK